jgi:hypothetical protein
LMSIWRLEGLVRPEPSLNGDRGRSRTGLVGGDGVLTDAGRSSILAAC